MKIVAGILAVSLVGAASAVEWSVTSQTWAPGSTKAITLSMTYCDSTVGPVFCVVPPPGLVYDHVEALGQLAGAVSTGDVTFGTDPYRFAVLMIVNQAPYDFLYGVSGPFAEVWLKNESTEQVRWCDGGAIWNPWVGEQIPVTGVAQCPLAAEDESWGTVKALWR